MFSSNWKIRPRLLFGIVATGIVIVTVVGLIVFTLFEAITEDALPELNSLHQLEVSAQDLLAEYNEYLLESDEESIDEIAEHESEIAIALQLYAATAAFEADEVEALKAIEVATSALHERGLLVIESQSTFNQKRKTLERLEQQFRQMFVDSESGVHRAENEVEIQAELDGDGPLGLEHNAFYAFRLLLTELQLETLEYIQFREQETQEEIEEIQAELNLRFTQLTASTSESSPQTTTQPFIISLGSEFSQSLDEILLIGTQLSDRRELLEQAADRLSLAIQAAIAITSEEVDNFLTIALLTILLLTVSMPAVMGLSMWLTTSAIIKPLFSLANSAKSIGRGELSTRVKLESKDEFGELARSFNLMAEELRQNEKTREIFVAQLEQKNTELERFTYTVSHDLKSPLVTVKGFLGLLERGLASGDTEQVNKDMQQIVSAADKMGNLLDDLLALSRIGHVVNKPQTFSLSQLTEEVIFLLQGVIKNCNAEIEIAADMPSVFADKKRISEVLQNLLENSMKFAGEGNKPRISVSAERQDEWVECRVKDNGIGIDPRYHDKVFGLFDRIGANVEGTGVGLTLVKRIIEVHKGHVRIESNGIGQGTEVCFTLPAPEGNIL